MMSFVVRWLLLLSFILLIFLFISIVRKIEKQTKIFLILLVLCCVIFVAIDWDIFLGYIAGACVIGFFFFAVYFVISLITHKSLKTSLWGVAMSFVIFLGMGALDTAIAKNAIKQIDKDEFMEQCISIDYDRCIRLPHEYEDINVQTSGIVFQVIENEKSTTLLVESKDGMWYITYDRPKNESRIIEGDPITCYGICNGVESYGATNGTQVTIPSMVMVCYNDN